MMSPRRIAPASILILLLASVAWLAYGSLTAAPSLAADAPAASPKADPALERTRKTVRMLDDLHKTAVVLITEHYVDGKDTLPAGSAAIALFDAMKKKGWYEVRLLDATGEPYEEKNLPSDDFEKAAVEQLRSGKDYHEQVIQRGKDQYLRAATPIPVAHKKCVMCHEAYKKAKPGEAIGALSYTIKIE
jgi:hypothetical protein